MSGADPEILGGDGGNLGAGGAGSEGRAPGCGFGGRKLNTFAYLTVNFDCTFAQKMLADELFC